MADKWQGQGFTGWLEGKVADNPEAQAAAIDEERVMGKVRSLTYEDNQSATLADMHEYVEALERERDEARAERDALAGYILLMADRDAVRASTGRTTND